MWKIPVLVLLCLSSTLAQKVPEDESSYDVVKTDETADTDTYDRNQDTEDDLWAEDGEDNYDYDWDLAQDTYTPLPDEEDKETGNTEQTVPTDTETSDKRVDIIDELNDWDANSLNDDDMYGGDAGVYGSDGEEEDEERYPADLSEYEDLHNWPDADDNSDVSESSDEVMNKPVHTPQLEQYGPSMVEGRKLGEYTVWHYAIFAIAGAIFILGIMIIVGAAIKAVRRPNSSYRRLADPVKV